MLQIGLFSSIFHVPWIRTWILCGAIIQFDAIVGVFTRCNLHAVIILDVKSVDPHTTNSKHEKVEKSQESLTNTHVDQPTHHLLADVIIESHSDTVQMLASN